MELKECNWNVIYCILFSKNDFQEGGNGCDIEISSLNRCSQNCVYQRDFETLHEIFELKESFEESKEKYIETKSNLIFQLLAIKSF